MSAQKALQGPETETRDDLLGGSEENGVSHIRGHFTKKETEKIESVA